MGYAKVNGLSLHFATRGAGKPLVLLHGGLGAGEMFGPVLPALAAHRRVIAVDLQGHGRTADIERPLRFESMADDIAALVRHLDLPSVDVMGYSLGGGVALRTAIQHPRLVRRLVLVSIPCKRAGWYPNVLAEMGELSGIAGSSNQGAAELMRDSPLYELYARVAPNPANWPVLLHRLGELLGRDYDWSAEVAALGAPTMLVYADADSVRTDHIMEFFRLLGGGRRDAAWDGRHRPVTRLAVLPGLTHYEVVTSSALPPAVLPFLTKPLRAPA